MKKILLCTMFATSLITGCATSPSLSTKSNVSVEKMKVAPVTVNLVQKFDNPTFYSEADLSNYLTECLITELAKKGKYSENAAPTLHFTLNYKRVYTGEAFGFHKVVSRPFLNYEYQIIENNKVLQQKGEEDVTVNFGLLGNLKTAMTMDLGNTEKNAEDDYLDAICHDISEKVY